MPVRVVRQPAAQVAAVFGHVVGQSLARCDPVGLTLEHRQVLDLLDAGVDDLHGRAARSDDGDPLPRQVDLGIPQGGVQTDARERVTTRYVRPARPVQIASRGDHDARMSDVAGAVAMDRVDLPVLAILVPPQCLDLGVEPGVLAEPVFVGQRHQIGLVLRALRIVVAPLGIHRPRQRVVRRRSVHPDAGVLGGQPGPPDLFVAVEDLVRDARLGGRQCDVDARDTGPDDGHLHRVGYHHGARKRGP